MKQKIDYRTSDMMETAFLLSKGFNFVSDKSSAKAVFFIFENVQGDIINSLIQEFHNNSPELRLLEGFRSVKKIAVFDKYQINFYKKDESNRNRKSKR